MLPDLQETEGLVTFTEEILNGKSQFLCSAKYKSCSYFRPFVNHQHIKRNINVNKYFMKKRLKATLCGLLNYTFMG